MSGISQLPEKPKNPDVVVLVTSIISGGGKSNTKTLDAFEGPALVTLTVNVMLLPSVAMGWSTVLITDSSAGLTATDALSWSSSATKKLFGVESGQL